MLTVADNIQTIPAHKYVLATGSSVFYAMFFGGLADNKQEIKVPDVEPMAFLTLLKYYDFLLSNKFLKINVYIKYRYLYCDEILLEADNVLATLYVAKKYIVPHLARACVTYLETSLTAKNACLLLSQSRLFEEPELMQRCWEVIDAQVCDEAFDSMHLADDDDIVIVKHMCGSTVVVNGTCSDTEDDGAACSGTHEISLTSSASLLTTSPSSIESLSFIGDSVNEVEPI